MSTHKILLSAFIVSIILNFIFLANMFTPPNSPNPRERHPSFLDPGEARAIVQVSEEYRPVVERIWREKISKHRREFGNDFSLKDNLRSLFLQPNIDINAIKVSMDSVHEFGNSMREVNVEALIEIAQILPLEERSKYFTLSRLGRPMPDPRLNPNPR